MLHDPLQKSFKPYQDQLGRIVQVPAIPQKIISLVPSQTELLFDLGLDAEIVGITKFCIHPNEKTSNKPIVGGTKNFRFEVIDQLQPDLIIANKEENFQEGLERLAEKYPVWISDIENLAQAQEMIAHIGEMVGRKPQAQVLNATIDLEFSKLQPHQVVAKVAYFIWRNPYMVAGKNTFIHEMLKCCGFLNPFAVLEKERYPQVAPEKLKTMDLHYIFLSSEPFPFQEKHLAELKAICPHVKVIFVDGEMFSWYGSRLAHAPKYFLQLQANLN